MKYKIEIASVPDREYVVAEIWSNQNMIAELNKENGTIELIIFPRQDSELILDGEGFIDALMRAKNKLLEE